MRTWSPTPLFFFRLFFNLAVVKAVVADCRADDGRHRDQCYHRHQDDDSLPSDGDGGAEHHHSTQHSPDHLGGSPRLGEDVECPQAPDGQKTISRFHIWNLHFFHGIVEFLCHNLSGHLTHLSKSQCRYFFLILPPTHGIRYWLLQSRTFAPVVHVQTWAGLPSLIFAFLQIFITILTDNASDNFFIQTQFFRYQRQMINNKKKLYSTPILYHNLPLPTSVFLFNKINVLYYNFQFKPHFPSRHFTIILPQSKYKLSPLSN